MSKNTLLSELINYVSANSSGNVTVAAPTSGLALDVNGTGRFTGQLTLGSTITNGTFTYTLPSATGTLALTSALSGYLPLSGGTLTGALSGTSASFSGAIIISNNAITQDGTRPIITLQQSGTTKAFWGISSASNDLVNGDSSGDAVFRKPASSGAFRFSIDGGSSSALILASTGAATFSSSVTASNIGINTSTLNSKLSVYKSDVSSGNSPASSGTTAVNGLAEFATNRGQGLYIGSQFSGEYGVWLQVSDRGNLGVNYALLLQPNGGNVGIGTTSPSYKLQVNGASGTIARITDGTNNLDFYAGSSLNEIAATTTLLLSTANTERMRITSAGNVGIGTTTPTSTANYATLALNGTSGGQLEFQTAGTGRAYIYSTVTSLFFFTNGGPYVFNNTTGLEIGFGLGQGSYKLDVNGTVRFIGALTGASATFSGTVQTSFLTVTQSGGQIGSFNSTNANGGYLTWSTSGTVIADIGTLAQIFGTGGASTFGINARGARDLAFGSNNTERMRITSGGDIGIGTDTINYAATNRRVLEINGTSQVLIGLKTGGANKGYIYHNGTNLYTENSHSGGDWYLAQVGAGNMIFSTNGSERMRITSGGNVLVGTTSDNGSKLQVEGLLSTKYVYYNSRVTERIGSRSGTGTYSLFTNGNGSTQSSGTIFVEAIYGTPNTTGQWMYKIGGNRDIYLSWSNTAGYSGSAPSVYWSGSILYVNNTDPNVYYSVTVRLNNIGIGWDPTWGNFPGLT